MKMTKSDAADLVLAVLGFVFLFAFLDSMVRLTALLTLPEQARAFTNVPAAVTAQVIHACILLVICFLLLVKRAPLVKALFPGAGGTAVELTEGLNALARYGFWIRLLGAVIFLYSLIGFIGQLVWDLGYKSLIQVSGEWFRHSVPKLVTAVLALLIAWQADAIGRTLEKLGNGARQSPPTAGS